MSSLDGRWFVWKNSLRVLSCWGDLMWRDLRWSNPVSKFCEATLRIAAGSSPPYCARLAMPGLPYCCCSEMRFGMEPMAFRVFM